MRSLLSGGKRRAEVLRAACGIALSLAVGCAGRTGPRFYEDGKVSIVVVEGKRIANVGQPWNYYLLFNGTLPQDPVELILFINGERMASGVGAASRGLGQSITFSSEIYYLWQGRTSTDLAGFPPIDENPADLVSSDPELVVSWELWAGEFNPYNGQWERERRLAKASREVRLSCYYCTL